jgi:urease accessory protein
VRRDGERTRLATLYEAGCSRVRLPRADGAEAVLINTSGGVADGDRLEQAITVTDGASLTVTTQAAEKIYRARSREPATIDSRLRLGPRSELHWLPQETILFDRARLRRSLEIETDSSATLLAVESVVLGRAAHGERVTEGLLEDRWDIRSDGRLVWADRFRLTGDIAGLTRRPAVMDGAGAIATILYVGPEAARWLEPVRGWLALLSSRGSVTRRGELLAIRLMAPTGDRLRASVAHLLIRWRSGLAGRPVPLPRVWRT